MKIDITKGICYICISKIQNTKLMNVKRGKKKLFNNEARIKDWRKIT